jgi:hypothetical protein
MKSLSVFAASLFLMGCAQTTPLVVGSDHPANADASAAPLTPPSTTLAISDTAATTSPSSSGMPAAHPGHDTGHAHATHASAPVSPANATTTQPAARAVYICPMHPEVVSDKPGTCPKCKMDLVKKGGAR